MGSPGRRQQRKKEEQSHSSDILSLLKVLTPQYLLNLGKCCDADWNLFSINSCHCLHNQGIYQRYCQSQKIQWFVFQIINYFPYLVLRFQCAYDHLGSIPRNFWFRTVRTQTQVSDILNTPHFQKSTLVEKGRRQAMEIEKKKLRNQRNTCFN